MTTIKDIYDWKNKPENSLERVSDSYRRRIVSEMLKDAVLSDPVLRHSYDKSSPLEGRANDVAGLYEFSLREYLFGVKERQPGIQVKLLIQALNSTGYYDFCFDEFNTESLRRQRLGNELSSYLFGAALSAGAFTAGQPFIFSGYIETIRQYAHDYAALGALIAGVTLSGLSLNGKDPVVRLVEASINTDLKIEDLKFYAEKKTEKILVGS